MPELKKFLNDNGDLCYGFMDGYGEFNGTDFYFEDILYLPDGEIKYDIHIFNAPKDLEDGRFDDIEFIGYVLEIIDDIIDCAKNNRPIFADDTTEILPTLVRVDEHA